MSTVTGPPSYPRRRLSPMESLGVYPNGRRLCKKLEQDAVGAGDPARGRKAYARAAAGSIPCRILVAAVCGDAMKARRCPAATGSAQDTEIPPENVVMLWIAAG